MFIPKKPRRMATRIPALPVRILPEFRTQDTRPPSIPGYRTICWACGIIEIAWVALLAVAICRLV